MGGGPAILLDATLVRGVLLPAMLTLLGDRAHPGRPGPAGTTEHVPQRVPAGRGRRGARRVRGGAAMMLSRPQGRTVRSVCAALPRMTP